VVKRDPKASSMFLHPFLRNCNSLLFQILAVPVNVHSITLHVSSQSFTHHLLAEVFYFLNMFADKAGIN
jgi:hypothetical protein